MASPKGCRTAKSQIIAAIIKALSSMEDAEVTGIFMLMQAIRDLPIERQAVQLKSMNPELSDVRIAKMLGIHRQTLANMPEFQRIKRVVVVLKNLPAGTVDDNGFIESYLRPEG